MKRFICALFAVCLLCMTAFADIIWEPDNTFYKWHTGACEMVMRSYWVNDTEGYVTVWDKPNGTPLANLPNGEQVYVHYCYKEEWGLVECTTATLREMAVTLDEKELPEGGMVAFWVPMEALAVSYDVWSFLDEAADAIREESQTIHMGNKNYCVYAYPGGPCTAQIKASAMNRLTTLQVSLIYEDEAGRVWGSVSRGLPGKEQPWFCLSDLENSELSEIDRQPLFYPAATGVPPLPMAGSNVTAWALLAVVLLCGVTAVLIVRMRKRR